MLLTDRQFKQLSRAFPSIPAHGTIFKVCKAIERLAGFKAERYDCCVESCACFVGPFETLTTCPYCGSDRFRRDGKPQKQFQYIPLIPRLLAMYWNGSLSQTLATYCSQYNHQPGIYGDIFDGSHYLDLKNRYIKIGNTHLHRFFFDDSRDIALGLSTDGFAPFKRRKQTCWPLLLFNYNIPPRAQV